MLEGAHEGAACQGLREVRAPHRPLAITGNFLPPAQQPTHQPPTNRPTNSSNPQVLESEQPAAAAAPAGPWHPTAVPGSRVAGGSDSSKAAVAAGKAGSSSRTGGGGGGGSSTSTLSCSAAALLSVAVAALAGAVGLMSMSGQAAGGGQ